jgi:translation initiation factor IF-3
MAALTLKRLTLQTMKSENNCIRRCFGKHIMQKTTPAQWSLIASSLRLSHPVHTKDFSIVEDTQDEKKKK